MRIAEEAGWSDGHTAILNTARLFTLSMRRGTDEGDFPYPTISEEGMGIILEMHREICTTCTEWERRKPTRTTHALWLEALRLPDQPRHYQDHEL